MEMDDEIARLGAVDRRLRLAAPGALGAVVIGKDADDVDLGGIAEFVAVDDLSIRRRTPDAGAAGDS